MKKILLMMSIMMLSFGYSQTAAPTAPARNAWDVISVFSGAYTNVGSNFFPNWGQSTTYEQVALGGDTALHYSNLNYQGVQFNSAINASSMTKLHIDYWTPSMTTFQVYLIAGGENAVNLTPTLSGWNSVDIDLATSYAARTLNNCIQFKFQSVPFGGTQVYIDNLYFWRPATSLPPPTISGFSVGSKVMGSGDFSLTPPTSNSAGAFSYTSSNTAVATVTGSTVHLVGVGTTTITANQAATGSYGAGTTSASLAVTAAPPASAAPTAPVRNAWDVKSVFSGAYTNFTGVELYPNWGQSTTYEQVAIGGDTTLHYNNFNYQGINIVPGGNAPGTNITGMTKLHIDYYTASMTTFKVSLIAGGENAVSLTPTLSGWNSVDLDLATSYPARDLTQVRQLKLESVPTGTEIYIDNVYFWRPETALPSPSLSNFSVASHAIGSSSFTLTDPTSNSAGTFSYTSSNTGVATITGNTVTVVGLGSTTITATQAGTASYSSGTITTVFDVTPVAAPTPTVDASHVKSLFSDSYTNVSNTNWFPNWGQTTVVSDVSIGGNATKKYTNLNYEGVQFSGIINASAMVSLHMDIWTPDCTSLEFHLINQPAPDQGITLTPTLSGWNSFDILLSQFTNINLATIGQFKFVGTPSGSTVYLDNIYFSDVPVTVAPIISGFSVPTKELGAADFNLTAPTSSSAGAFTYSSSNTNVATITGNTVTVVGIGTTTITATQAAAGSYFGGSTTANFVVIAPLPTAPVTAAPTPPVRNTGDVKSLFSDAYSNVSGTNWFPNWGQTTTMQDITIVGDNTKVYSNMNYQGVQFASAVNASAMTKLHIDLWSSTCTAFEVRPIVAGQPEQGVILNPTIAGWNSFDIDLTQYTIPLTSIIQLKFIATPSGTKVFLDNIYFWKPDTTPNITGFNVPAKLIGAAPFTLTAPSSNSSGAFTYTSSNTNVATIIGNTVTIVGAGSTTITANQAAAAPYFAGFTSATLLVSYPGPTVAAPTPTLNASKVISLYSNAYTNVSNIDWFPNWGQLTHVTNTTAGGNDVKKYTTMNYQGVQFATPIDATAMTQIHLDVWTPNCTAFEVYLVNQTIAEQKVTLTPTLSGWNSFDIPLNQYSNINLASIGQLKFVSAPYGTGELYLDNVYFSNNSVTIKTALCGTTLAALNSDIAPTNYPGAQMYRFEVSNGATVVGTYDISSATPNNFALAKLSGITYGTTYSIRVAIKINDTWGAFGTSCDVTTPTLSAATIQTTKITPAFCGTTLATLDTKIAANVILNATGYRFEITTGGVTTVYDSSTYNFTLFQTGATVAYGTSYAIRVAAKVNGVYGNYGTSCTVTTPTLVTNNVPTTTIQASFCGATLAALNTKIGAVPVYGATKARYEVTIAGGSPVVYEVAASNFMLSQTGVAVLYSTNYAIRVAALVGGVWGNYGASCTVTTPAAPAPARLKAKSFEVSAYPNPFDSAFNLNLETPNKEDVTIAVYDMIGKLVETHQVNPMEVANLQIGSNFATGIYNVIVSQANEMQAIRLIRK